MTWRRVDLAAGVDRLAAAGPLVAVAFLPALLVLCFDALGLKLLLAPARRRQLPLAPLWAGRLCGEAVSQSLPSAGLAGEAASAWYLSRHTTLTLGESIGSLAARRVRIAQGHAAVLALAALVALGMPGIPGRLAALCAASALGLLLAAGLGELLLLRGAPFTRLERGLRRLPWGGLRGWAGAHVASFRVAHREAARPLVEAWPPRLLASACFALVFLTEAFETWLLLRLVGAQATFGQALAIEPLVALLRALVFFVPAGLGVQDLGYVALLELAGVPQLSTVGAGFVLLKRTKELAWTALGWGVLLAVDAKSPSAELAPAEPGSETEVERERAAEDPVRLRVAQPDDADAPDRARVA